MRQSARQWEDLSRHLRAHQFQKFHQDGKTDRLSTECSFVQIGVFEVCELSGHFDVPGSYWRRWASWRFLFVQRAETYCQQEFLNLTPVKVSRCGVPLASAKETESSDGQIQVVSEQRGDEWQVSLSGRITRTKEAS